MGKIDKILQNSKLFLKRNSSTILTCAGAAGVIATAVAAVTSTPKAMRLLKEKEESKGEKLTTTEVIKVAGPVYIPSILIGASTIACIFGANVLNRKQQTTLVGLYSLLDNTYKNYKSNVRETFGEDADTKISQTIANRHSDIVILANDNYDGNTPYEIVSGKDLFMDFCTLDFFYSTLEDIKNAEKFLNDILNMRGCVYLNEYKTSLGLESMKSDYELCWTISSLSENGFDKLVLSTELIKLDNGKDCYVLTVPSDPIMAWEI